MVAGLIAETEAATDVRVVVAVSASVAAAAGDVDVVDALMVVVAGMVGVGVVAEVATSVADEDYVQVVVAAVVGIVAEPMDQRDSYHLDCYTAAQ